MTRPSKPASKKAPRKKAHKEPAVHHSSAHHPVDHHAHSHDRPERRIHPRGDDIFTKIQDATEKVLRERKHELKK